MSRSIEVSNANEAGHNYERYRYRMDEFDIGSKKTWTVFG